MLTKNLKQTKGDSKDWKFQVLNRITGKSEDISSAKVEFTVRDAPNELGTLLFNKQNIAAGGSSTEIEWLPVADGGLANGTDGKFVVHIAAGDTSVALIQSYYYDCQIIDSRLGTKTIVSGEYQILAQITKPP